MSHEEDYVFTVHRDFSDRTGGLKSSLCSTVGDYCLNLPLCQQIMTDNNWGELLQKANDSSKAAKEHPDQALEIELQRRYVVRELVESLTATIQHDSQATVATHHVIEMVTGWVLHERNDPKHDDALRQLMTEKSGGAWSPSCSKGQLFPLRLWRRHVLPSDTQARVVVKGHSEVYCVTELVNRWRARIQDEAGKQSEAELCDLELVEATPQILDALIPSPDMDARGASTAVFVRLLKWCNDDRVKAAGIGDRITTIVKEARQKLYQSTISIVEGTPLLNKVTCSFSAMSVAGETVEAVEISYGALRCPILKRAWVKMAQLFSASNPCTADPGQLDVTIATRLLVVLLRYASLSGAASQNVDQTAGFHAAVPPPIYALLRQKLNCVVEGFASPMNSTSSHYCSLFPDCDAYFGSLGSFFDLSVETHFPNGISMTCNPPYSIVVMLRVAEQLTKLFSSAEQRHVPMQVFVVVCNWNTVAGTSGNKILESLKTHPYCVRHQSIEASKAPFQDGHAFVLNRPFFTLGSNTEVFLFQNADANTRWPAHRSAFDEIVVAWSNLVVAESSSLPSSSRKRSRTNE